MASVFDDGSSTETEVYLDPAELATYSLANVEGVTNEVVDLTGDDDDLKEELQPPPGSEWSHGAVSHECDILAVEKALQLAGSVQGRAQKEESLTADTLKGNESREQVNSNKKTESRVVSLRSTPVQSVAKPVAVGLRRPLSTVVGALPELEKELSVPRSSPPRQTEGSQPRHLERKRKRSQSPGGEKTVARHQEREPSRHHVDSQTRERGKSVARPHAEQEREPSRRHEESSSRHREERGKSQARNHSEQSSKSTRHPGERLPRQEERGKSQASHQEERGREPSRHPGDHDKSSSRHHESSPRSGADHSKSAPRHQVESPPRTWSERSKSQARRYPEQSRSPPRRHPASPPRSRHYTDYNRSPPRYLTYRSKSQARASSRRSSSRSPPARRVVETRTRRSRSRSPRRDTRYVTSNERSASDRPYRRVEATSSSRQTRTPVESSRSHSRYERQRTRSRSRDREEKRRDDRTRDDRSSNKDSEKSAAVPESRTSRDAQRKDPRTTSASAKAIQGEIGGSEKSKATVASNAEKTTYQQARTTTTAAHASSTLSQHQDKHPPKHSQVTSQASKKPLTTPKPQALTGNKRKAMPSTPGAVLHQNSNAHPRNNTAKARHNPLDSFAKRLFKVKLREADVNEKAESGSLDSTELGILAGRRKKIAADLKQLEAEDYERFWELNESMTVPKYELENYQRNRDFSWRVVQFKRKQATLEEQQHLSLSPAVARKLWEELEKERESLEAENAFLFNKIMKDPTQGGVTPASRALLSNAITPARVVTPRQPINRAHHDYFNEAEDEQLPQKRRLNGRATFPRPGYSPAYNSYHSRVVVGESLLRQHPNAGFAHARTNDDAWFLKG